MKTLQRVWKAPAKLLVRYFPQHFHYQIIFSSLDSYILFFQCSGVLKSGFAMKSERKDLHQSITLPSISDAPFLPAVVRKVFSITYTAALRVSCFILLLSCDMTFYSGTDKHRVINQMCPGTSFYCAVVHHITDFLFVSCVWTSY